MIKNESSKKVGLPPGSLVYVGNKKTEEVSVFKIDFSENLFEKIDPADISKYISRGKEDLISWIDISGVHDASVIESVGTQLNIDPLIQEDIMNTNHRPTVDVHDNYLFVLLKTLKPGKTEKDIKVEQISMILGQNWLLSFEEAGSDTIKKINKQIHAEKGIQQRKEDYVFYRIIDNIVDNYLLFIDSIEDSIESMEEELIKNPKNTWYDEIYDFKKQIALFKKAIIPLRDIISTIIKSDLNYISESSNRYFRDVHDHIIQLIEESDSLDNKLNDFLNMYMSGLSNKMNEVMQVLTIFASIFIPLTFIAGVYGMNFDIMPELHWKHGYYITWGVMLGMVVALLIYFRRKKWL